MQFTIIVLEAHLPPSPMRNIGVLALDDAADRLYVRFLTDFDLFNPEDAEVLEGLPTMLESMALEQGALGVVQFLEDSASNVVRLGDRIQLEAASANEAVAIAFNEYVLGL